jgi:hypothetical protein
MTSSGSQYRLPGSMYRPLSEDCDTMNVMLHSGFNVKLYKAIVVFILPSTHCGKWKSGRDDVSDLYYIASG